MTEILTLWRWSQTPWLNRAGSIHRASPFSNSDTYFCIILTYDSSGVFFFPLSFSLSADWSFCKHCCLFIRLELLIPSNCSGAQAAATVGRVSPEQKVVRWATECIHWVDTATFTRKHQRKTGWRRVSFKELHLMDHRMKHYLCALAAAGDLSTKTLGELLWIRFKDWAEVNWSPQFSSRELQDVSGPSKGRKDGISKHHWCCDGNRNDSARTAWRLISPYHQCCLPVLNGQRKQRWPNSFLPLYLLWSLPSSLPTTSLQQVPPDAQALEASKQAPHRAPVSAGLCYCSSDKHRCFWKINARMAAAQRKTCKYTPFGRRLCCNLRLHLCSLSRFGSATQKRRQNTSQRLGLVSEPSSCKHLSCWLVSVTRAWSWLVRCLMHGVLLKQTPNTWKEIITEEQRRKTNLKLSECMLQNRLQLNALKCNSILDASKTIHKWEKKLVLILRAHVSIHL